MNFEVKNKTALSCNRSFPDKKWDKLFFPLKSRLRCERAGEKSDFTKVEICGLTPVSFKGRAGEGFNRQTVFLRLL